MHLFSAPMAYKLINHAINYTGIFKYFGHTYSSLVDYSKINLHHIYMSNMHIWDLPYIIQTLSSLPKECTWGFIMLQVTENEA